MKNIPYNLKKVIREDRVETRKLFFRLRTVRFTILVFAISIVLIVLSFFCRKYHPWISSTLLSIGASDIVGVVLFFLTNIRNNEFQNISSDVTFVSELIDSIFTIIHLQNTNWKEDSHDNKFLFFCYEKLVDISREMPESLCEELISFIGYNPLDEDNLKSYRNQIEYAFQNRNYKQPEHFIFDELEKVYKIICPDRKEKEKQLNMLVHGIF